MTKAAKTKVVRERRIPTSSSNISKAAVRLLSQNLVTAEVEYVQRSLGASATHSALDAQIVAVRRLPWSTIAPQD